MRVFGDFQPIRPSSPFRGAQASRVMDRSPAGPRAHSIPPPLFPGTAA